MKNKHMEDKYKNIIPGKPERIGGNLETMEKVYDSSFTLLNEKDLPETALRCGAGLEEGKKLILRYFKEELVVDINSRKLYYRKNKEDMDIFSATLMLHYIVNADGEALSGKWISYRELPDGMFYFRTIPGVLEPLLDKYEDSFELLLKKVEEYGGFKNSGFRNGAIIHPYPYFPVLLILEERSDEFDPDLRALFDSNASHYMKTDMIKVLLVNIVKLLTQ